MPNPFNTIVNVVNTLVSLAGDKLFRSSASVRAQSIDYTTCIQVDMSDETKYEIFPGIPPELGSKIFGYFTEQQQLPLRLVSHAFRLRVDDLTIAQIAQWDTQQAEIDHFIANKNKITDTFKNSIPIMSSLESVKNAPTIKSLAAFLAREKILDNINCAIINERIENPPATVTHFGLDLNNCNLTRFPASIINNRLEFFNSLQSLTLYKNELQTLPCNFNQLVKLEHLIIGINKLGFVPDIIKDLNKLKVLDVAYNQISLLPDWIGEFLLLQTLDIANNQLIRLPASISQLIELQYLYANYNNLESMPDLSTLSKLIYLDVAYNQIRTFPSGLERIHSLWAVNIHNNCLTEIPEGIAESKISGCLNLTKALLLASQKPMTKKHKVEHSGDDEKDNSSNKRLRV